MWQENGTLYTVPFHRRNSAGIKISAVFHMGIQKLLSLTVASDLTDGDEKVLSCAAKGQFKHGQANSICQLQS